MKRAAVIGPGGAGKSTLARQMGEKLALPVVHLDVVYWHEGCGLLARGMGRNAERSLGTDYA
ncbi:MAG: hypothetical protein ACRYFS_14005 [Janthinobacterium lividum]